MPCSYTVQDDALGFGRLRGLPDPSNQQVGTEYGYHLGRLQRPSQQLEVLEPGPAPCHVHQVQRIEEGPVGQQPGVVISRRGTPGKDVDRLTQVRLEGNQRGWQIRIPCGPVPVDGPARRVNTVVSTIGLSRPGWSGSRYSRWPSPWPSTRNVPVSRSLKVAGRLPSSTKPGGVSFSMLRSALLSRLRSSASATLSEARATGSPGSPVQPWTTSNTTSAVAETCRSSLSGGRSTARTGPRLGASGRR